MDAAAPRRRMRVAPRSRLPDAARAETAAHGRRSWRLAACAPIVASACLVPALAVAQAWLPERGALDLGVAFETTYSAKHYLPDGGEVDVGHTTSDVVSVYFSYGITDTLSIAAGVPYVRRQYAGSRPHPTEVDDGHAHGAFTDARLELHWQAIEGAIALAPYLAAVVPTHDYETLGHAAPGRGLNELWVGSYAGAVLEPWLPRTYVQLQYAYAFVEKVVGIAHDRSSVDLEFGHFLRPEWGVAAYVSWQTTHGGIDVPIPPSHPLFEWHDQIADEEHLNVGAGVSWAPNRTFSVSLRYMTSLRGRNGHKLDDGFTLAFGWRPGAFPPSAAAASP